jgi:hypothetical protein
MGKAGEEWKQPFHVGVACHVLHTPPQMRAYV